MLYIIENLSLNALKLPGSYCRELPRIVSKELHLDLRQITRCEILSSSIDSRRGVPKIILKLLLETGQVLPHLTPVSTGEIAALEIPHPEIPDSPSLLHPIVVGTGPAGISAAYLLAAAGCKPLILDRGYPVEKREDHFSFL